MQENVIEQSVVPYTPAASVVINKEKYNMFAPLVGTGKMGMASFAVDQFNIANHEVSIKPELLVSETNTLLLEIVATAAAHPTPIPPEKLLPAVTNDDNGQVLTVQDGAWAPADLPIQERELPTITGNDDGKVLMIKDGQWGSHSLPTVEDELPAINAGDDGKVLGVQNGGWALTTPAVPDVLPEPNMPDDNGKVLTAFNGNWIVADLPVPPDELPAVTNGDDGQVLTVKNGAWAAADLPAQERELPAVTAANNGKFLGVANGYWSLVDPPKSTAPPSSEGGGGGISDEDINAIYKELKDLDNRKADVEAGKSFVDNGLIEKLGTLRTEQELAAALAGKVDVVDGSSLMTAEEHAKLEDLPDKNALDAALAGKVDVVSGKSLVDNKLIAKLNDLPDESTLDKALAGKVDVVDGSSLMTAEEHAKLEDLPDKNALDAALAGKVDVVSGKSLVDNTLIAKLNDLPLAKGGGAGSIIQIGNTVSETEPGQDTTRAIALGYQATASGRLAFVLGEAAGTGENKIYPLTSSHLGVNFGLGNRVTGAQAFAQGLGLKANKERMFVHGQYNEEPDSGLAHVIGWGYSNDTRTNIYTLDTSGNAVYGPRKTYSDGRVIRENYGEIKCGKITCRFGRVYDRTAQEWRPETKADIDCGHVICETPEEDAHAATKGYVDTQIASILTGEGTADILDTIQEIREALNDNPNAYNDLLGLIGGKVDTTTLATELAKKVNVEDGKSLMTDGERAQLSTLNDQNLNNRLVTVETWQGTIDKQNLNGRLSTVEAWQTNNNLSELLPRLSALEHWRDMENYVELAFTTQPTFKTSAGNDVSTSLVRGQKVSAGTYKIVWAFNKKPATVKIDTTNLSVTGTQYEASVTLVERVYDTTKRQSWVITATDMKPDNTEVKLTRALSTDVFTFGNYAWYGYSDSTTRPEPTVGTNKLWFGNTFTRPSTMHKDSGSGYVILCMPYRYIDNNLAKLVGYKFGGFSYDFDEKTTFNYTNAYGYTEKYVYARTAYLENPSGDSVTVQYG